MQKVLTPQAQDWNHYWSLDQTQQFTKLSWSKRRMMEILKPFAALNKKVLDAGCGSGFFSKYFCDQGMSTVALDYSDAALNIAYQLTQGHVAILKRDLLAAGLSKDINERFDLIFSDGLLEHFPHDDQNKIMRNLVSLLNDQGLIITFVPNRWSPWELIRPFFMPGIEETPFVLSQLIDLHEQNGLKIIGHGGINTVPFRFSPDKLIGHLFGMLLFTIAQKNG